MKVETKKDTFKFLYYLYPMFKKKKTVISKM